MFQYLFLLPLFLCHLKHLLLLLKIPQNLFLSPQGHQHQRDYGPLYIHLLFRLPYLYYTYSSSRYLPDQEYTYGELRDFITEKIDLDKIKRHYNADSAIFFTYYNQTKKDKNGGYAWSWDFNANASEPYAVEIIWITDEDNDLEVSAGGLAHEMMHCFGAVDLYRSSDKVPQKYVNHLKSSRSKDIMYFIDYSTPDTIKEKFTDLDAYYMGLISQCKDQKNYGLIKSSFADCHKGELPYVVLIYDCGIIPYCSYSE